MSEHVENCELCFDVFSFPYLHLGEPSECEEERKLQEAIGVRLRQLIGQSLFKL